MRNEKEIEKELLEVSEKVKNEFRKEHEKELKGEKYDYTLFHQLCREEKELKKELETTKRFNVKVNDGVTIHIGSDAHACTIIGRTKTTLTIQRDKATLKKDWKPEIIPGGFVGHCINQDSQEYDYERDEKGHIYKAHWSNAKGKFIVEGCLPISNGRYEFYDYNF